MIDNKLGKTAMEALLSFIGEIYEASYRPEHWNTVFLQLCQKLGAKAGGLHVEDHASHSRYILASYNIPKLAQVSYRLGMAKYDPVFQLQANRPVGQAAEVINPDVAKADFPLSYRFIMKPQDIGRVAAISLFNDEEWHVGIGLHRGFQDAPFNEQDLQLLDTLTPHFQRALRIQKTLQQAQSREATLQGALSQLMLGVIILNHEDTVVYHNAMAQTLLKQHPALQIRSDRLHAHHPDEGNALLGITSNLRQSDSRDVETRDHAMGLRHPNRDHPLTVIITKLEESPFQQSPANSIAASGHIALYIADPACPFSAPEEHLMTTFGLTRREAGVAIALANGLGLQEIGELNQIGKETVRSQLKGIFSKLGVNKQQDVIRLILNSQLHATPPLLTEQEA